MSSYDGQNDFPNNALKKKFISLFMFTFLFMSFAAMTGVAMQVKAAGLSEGFLIEADLKQGARSAAGRVLIEAGHKEWMTIATTPATKQDPVLRLEARATLVEADVVEIETRIFGRGEQNGRMIVRVGERGEMTTTQLEGASNATPPTSVGLKVLRVRYGL